MPDIASISAGLQAVKLAIDIAKDLRSTESAFKDAEAKLKLVDLMEALAEARVQLLDAQEENLALQKEIHELQSKLNEKDEVVFRNGLYYYADPKPGKPEGPFCPHCYQTKDKLLLLKKAEPAFQVFGEYVCSSCKEHFGVRS